MNTIDILILALIQGAAELLPVSSSAHVIFAMRWLRQDPTSPQMTFLLIMLHTGTMGAVLVYFWRSWQTLLLHSPETAEVPKPCYQRINWPILWHVVWATGVTGFLGLGLLLFIEKGILEGMLGHEHGEIEYLFGELWLVGVALFLVGLFIIAAGFYEKHIDKGNLTRRSSIIIGLVQGLCIPFRGFSRSGATISAGLFCGVHRRLAEEFSFLLVVVLTPAAIVWEGKRLVLAETSTSTAQLLEVFWPGLLGMLFSFLSGLAALKLLSALLEGGRWRYFGYYCLAAAAVLWLSTGFGWLPPPVTS